MGGQYSLSANGFINKQFKKTNDFQLSSSTRINASKSRDTLKINRQGGYQNSYDFSVSQEFSLNWKDIIEIRAILRGG